MNRPNKIKKEKTLFKIFFFLICAYSFADSNKAILLIEPWYWTQAGGLGINNLYQAKKFKEHGQLFYALFSKGTISQNYFKQHDLPYLLFQTIDLKSFNFLPIEAVRQEIMLAYEKYGIRVVITPRYEDLHILTTLAKEIPIKVIFVRHGSFEQDKYYDVKILKNVDAVVAGNMGLYKHISHANIEHNLGIKHIVMITPFWDEPTCFEFETDQTKNEYFKKRFDITIKNEAVLCTIANLYDPCKNHPLLFQAMDYLIHTNNRNIHLMLAGNGPLKSSLEKMASDLGIQKYVHFLGSITDVNALLYHSDIHILPSYHESFALANLEAAAMKKPIIMAAGTDSAQLLEDGKTGLLFINKDLSDLIAKIEYVLDNPKKRIEIGNNAYQHVKNNYSNEMLYQQWQAIINQVMLD